MPQHIKIYHLYPDAMNLYGDLGNIITLVRRCQWRGIDAEVVDVHVGDKVDFADADILFMGGGQDSGQKIVGSDLLEKGPEIKKEIDKGLVALLICGGFQLFGKYFQTSTGEKIPGIDVFDAYTVAGNKRIIGNIVVDIGHTLSEIKDILRLQQLETSHLLLVGFENHSGATYLGDSTPLGYVQTGGGNIGDGGYEGCVYKNAFGTYLHGSLLPKNPWFADNLIMLALLRRYGSVTELAPLDDAIELAAQQNAIKRSETAKSVSI
jgi:CobQ-like glutamine amidotransferase family enzyme